MGSAISLLLLAYVPGALIFRAPVGARTRREALPADERVFWCVLLSVALSSGTALALAAGGWYGFDRVLAIDAAIALAIVSVFRGRLRYSPAAPGPAWDALLPMALVIGGSWITFLVPPAEYIMGGKDPGIYLNEGIQIAQHGALVVNDPVVSAIPVQSRGLFFPAPANPDFPYRNRFMGFFLLDPGRGEVVGQFPHLYPASIALAYGVDGLSGARLTTGLWAVLGLLAVYFAGVRLAGRFAAAAGAGLLAVHVLQVWNGRYPNAEIVMQPLAFGALLAYARAQSDDDPFFAPVAASLAVLCVFAHITGVLIAGALAAAASVAFAAGGRVRLSFAGPLVLGGIIAVAYLAAFLPPYFNGPAELVRNLEPLDYVLLALAIVGGVGLMAAARRAQLAPTRWLTLGLTAAVWALAGYALFVRTAGGPLAVHDADSLRTFTSFYLTPFGLAAALIGFALIGAAAAPDAAFLFTIALYSMLFFYKIRIVPEHFWAGRRFLAVVLPGALLLAGAAAFGDLEYGWRWRGFESPAPRLARKAAGLALVLLLGWHFFGLTRPILRHVEYAGLIPRLERLAATFGDDDLLLVESRAASDVHVLALPLAYIYARPTLVLAAPNPNKQAFREFLTWAHGRYRHVFFIGGGGTELLSRAMTVKTIGGERFQIPEYESLVNAYPRHIRSKEFDLGIYEFLPGTPPAEGFALDVGTSDDLYVRHFHAKEQLQNRFTFRWTRELSFVSILGTRPDQRVLTLWMADGRRPPSAGDATVDVFLNDRLLGHATARPALEPYRFEIPAELAAAIAQSDDAAELRLATHTWNPATLLGNGDDRDLGVMVDRIEIK